METCLFTGEVLSAATREEHTIPRGLGGRIRSRLVICDTFNERSGAYLDETLKSPYALLMNTLGPLLSAEHQPGLVEVEVPGDQPGLVLDGGALTRRNLAIVDRDAETGMPRSAVAADGWPLRNLARQLGREDQATFFTVRASEGTTYFRSGPVIFADIEVAALKSAMLTFDHMLRQTQWRFTRHPKLQTVRDFVQSAVMERRMDGEACNRFSLGLQYDRADSYRRLREQVPFATTPFEHFLVASTCAPYRCIDLVWSVFGFDPFGFRVCYDWDGGEFAFGIVNGVLRETSHSEAVPLPPLGDLLCHPTMRRAFPDVPSSSAGQQDLMLEAMEAVSNRRLHAYREAVYYVEMHADDSVRARLMEAASLDPVDQRSVGVQLCRKLERLYGRTSQADVFAQVLGETFARRTRDLPEAIRSQEITTANPAARAVDWAVWLQVYRDCLGDLSQVFGLPGDTFQNRSVVRGDREGERLVGDLPPD